MRAEPGLSEATILVLANDVVHDVRQEASHHQDLHVITFPAVLQMSRNLQENIKVKGIAEVQANLNVEITVTIVEFT